jgi:hypothetical protein
MTKQTADNNYMEQYQPELLRITKDCLAKNKERTMLYLRAYLSEEPTLLQQLEMIANDQTNR